MIIYYILDQKYIILVPILPILFPQGREQSHHHHGSFLWRLGPPGISPTAAATSACVDSETLILQRGSPSHCPALPCLVVPFRRHGAPELACAPAVGRPGLHGGVRAFRPEIQPHWGEPTFPLSQFTSRPFWGMQSLEFWVKLWLCWGFGGFSVFVESKGELRVLGYGGFLVGSWRKGAVFWRTRTSFCTASVW
jgi:hypothetical protein